MINNPKSYLHLLLIFFLIQTSHQQCEPLFPRMFWNPQQPKIQSTEINLKFMFNTEISCPYSYMHLFYRQNIYKFRCSQQKLETYNEDGTVQFVHYVQKCDAFTKEDYQIEEFRYILFGSKQLSDQPGLKSEQFLVELPTNDLPLRMVVTADWGPIINKTYIALNNTFDYMLQKRSVERKSATTNQWRVNGIILAGDYAYDLQTDNCQMYLKFLNQLSRISKYWPMIIMPGNHQTNGRPKSWYIFEKSFIIGNLTVSKGNFERVQPFRFVGKASFLLYDPYLEMFSKSTNEKYEMMKQKMQSELINARKNSPDEFTMISSHYPVACTQEAPHCRDAIGKMPELFEFMSGGYEGKGLVDLYLGAHQHQYERIKPYVRGQFIGETSPFKRGRMVSVVEGVAGMNDFMTEEEFTPAYFSQHHTVNTTGFGILTISGSVQKQDFKLNYQHIITPQIFEVADHFEIEGSFSENNLKPSSGFQLPLSFSEE